MALSYADWPDEALCRLWITTFAAYLQEALEGKRLLDDAEHARLGDRLEALDAEIRRRGYPVPPGYTQAFRSRILLPEAELGPMLVACYGRDVRTDAQRARPADFSW
jgi:hypothetical protein